MLIVRENLPVDIWAFSQAEGHQQNSLAVFLLFDEFIGLETEITV